MQTEQMTGIRCFCVGEESGEIAFAARGVDPFSNCAVGSVAVVEDCCRPAGENCQTGPAVGGDGRGQGPEFIDCVHEDWSGIVTNDVGDAVLHPGLDYVWVC